MNRKVSLYNALLFHSFNYGHLSFKSCIKRKLTNENRSHTTYVVNRFYFQCDTFFHLPSISFIHPLFYPKSVSSAAFSLFVYLVSLARHSFFSISPIYCNFTRRPSCPFMRILSWPDIHSLISLIIASLISFQFGYFKLFSLSDSMFFASWRISYPSCSVSLKSITILTLIKASKHSFLIFIYHFLLIIKQQQQQIAPISSKYFSNYSFF